MLRQWHVIANLQAGHGRCGQAWPKLQGQIAAELPVSDWSITQERGHAIALTEQAIAQGSRHILAVGGDGTNHEVANGILRQTQLPPTAITHALLPLGTGNDWAKTHGLPTRPEAALKVIAAGKTRLQDVGRIHYHSEGEKRQRYFVNVAGLAYDGYVVRRSMEQTSNRAGRLHYLALIVRCLFEYSLRAAEVTADGQTYRDRFYTINFGIGKYSGNGMQLVPHAVPDKGAFAVTLAGALSKLGVLLNTYRFYNGSIGSHPKVSTFFAQQALVQACPGELPTLLEADGEFLGETPAEFELLPAALRIVVP